jgi:hypothetical protein
MKMLALPALLVLAFAGCASMKKTETPPTPPQKTAATLAAEKAAADAKVAPKSESGLVCKNGKDERNLEIKKDGNGCAINYTKFGKSEVIASSTNGKKHCEDVMAKIQKNLEGAGFQCK